MTNLWSSMQNLVLNGTAAIGKALELQAGGQSGLTNALNNLSSEWQAFEEQQAYMGQPDYGAAYNWSQPIPEIGYTPQGQITPPSLPGAGMAGNPYAAIVAPAFTRTYDVSGPTSYMQGFERDPRWLPHEEEQWMQGQPDMGRGVDWLQLDPNYQPQLNAAGQRIAGMDTPADLIGTGTPWERSEPIDVFGAAARGVDAFSNLVDKTPITGGHPLMNTAAQLLGLDLPTTGEVVDRWREAGIDAAGLMARSGVGPVGLLPENIARGAADVFLPRSTLEVLGELLPGVGFVDDLARAGSRLAPEALGALPEASRLLRNPALEVPQFSDEAAALARRHPGLAGVTSVNPRTPTQQVAQMPFGQRVAGAADETIPPASSGAGVSPSSAPAPQTLSEGDAVLALRNALREGTGAQRAAIVQQGRRSQAARLAGVLEESDAQGLALAREAGSAGAGRILPEDGIGFALPKEADDALIDKAIAMWKAGDLSVFEATYGVPRALDEGRRLGPTPAQARLLGKLTSIDEAAFEPYVRARRAFDTSTKEFINQELAKVGLNDPPRVRQQLQSARRAEILAEAADARGQAEQAARYRQNAANHRNRADEIAAQMLKQTEQRRLDDLIAQAQRRDMQDLWRTARRGPTPVDETAEEARSRLARQGRQFSPEAKARQVARLDEAQARQLERTREELRLEYARHKRELQEATERWERIREQKPTAAMNDMKALSDELNARMAEAAPSVDNILARAQQLLVGEGDLATKMAISEDKARTALNVLDYHLRGNEAIMSRLKDAEGWREYLGGVRALATGELSDSFLTSVMYRTQAFNSALLESGIDPDVARKVSNLVQNFELERRFPDGIPQRVINELETMKNAPYEESLAGLDLFVQRWKNSVFGLTDFGVMGVQVLAAARRGSIQAAAGFVNRTLGALQLPHIETHLADVALEKKLRNILDGVHYGSASAGVQPEAGTMLRYLGKPGKWADDKITPAIELSTKVQFDGIMGWVGDNIYEGQLVMLHALGRDINNPRVRAQAAEAANNIKSFASQALRSGRGGFERKMLTSPAMTRSQIGTILQMAKVFNPKASAEERILGAGIIASTALYGLVVGKFINDQVGITDFIFDPSEQGFGQIVLPQKGPSGRNLVIDLFPQASIDRAIARSFRELAEGDEDQALDAWLRYFSGRSSSFGGGVLGTAGIGYSTSAGGRFTRNLSALDRVLNWAPIPPIFSTVLDQISDGGLDPIRLGISFFGLSGYGESGYAALSRSIENEGIPALIDMGALPESLRGSGRSALGSGEDDALMAWIRENKPELLDQYIEDRRKSGSIFQKTADAASELDETKYKPELDKLLNALMAGADPQKVFDEQRRLMDRRQGERAQIYGKDFQSAIKGLEPNDIRSIENIWESIPANTRDEFGFIDWAGVEEKRGAFIDELASADPAMAQRFANNILLRDRTADMHPLLQLKAEVDTASRPYFDVPSNERDQWLRANPDVNAQRWLIYGTSLQSVEAVEQALNSGISREVTLSGSKVPITEQNLPLLKENEQRIQTLFAAQGNDRTNLRKSDVYLDALWVYLGFAEVAQSDLNAVNRLLESWGSPLRARAPAR